MRRPIKNDFRALFRLNPQAAHAAFGQLARILHEAICGLVLLLGEIASLTRNFACSTLRLRSGCPEFIEGQGLHGAQSAHANRRTESLRLPPSSRASRGYFGGTSRLGIRKCPSALASRNIAFSCNIAANVVRL